MKIDSRRQPPFRPLWALITKVEFWTLEETWKSADLLTVPLPLLDLLLAIQTTPASFLPSDRQQHTQQSFLVREALHQGRGREYCSVHNIDNSIPG